MICIVVAWSYVKLIKLERRCPFCAGNDPGLRLVHVRM